MTRRSQLSNSLSYLTRDLNSPLPHNGRRSDIRTGKLALASGIAAAVVLYFAASLYFLPQSYMQSIHPPRPGPVVTDVSISNSSVKIGEAFTIHVAALNKGDHADMQIVSIAFPNATRPDVVTVLKHDFKQTPLVIKPGQEIGAGYNGPQKIVQAQYPAIEASSRPWESGQEFNIDLSAKPEVEGRFVILVKVVGLPHNGEQAHFPQAGILDQQDEYVAVYAVDVTKD